MINFLTEEFFWKQRLKKIIIISIIIFLLLGTLISNRLVNLKMENKELNIKLQIIDERIERLDKKTARLNNLREKNKELEKRVFARQQQARANLFIDDLIRELSNLAIVELHLVEFEVVNNNKFVFTAITDDMDYLNELIEVLEELNFFKNYYLEEIIEDNSFIKFSIRGEFRKEMD